MSCDGRHFDVFVRNWWRMEPSRFGGPATKVPDPGARKTYIARRVTEEEARQICQRYAATHKPGRLSRKAEYESR
jgi:hypothetical protein